MAIKHTIRKYLSKQEYDILFCSKHNWYEIEQDNKKNWNKSSKSIAYFNKTLQKFINLQNETSAISFNDIIFPSFKYNNFKIPKDKKIFFENVRFEGSADFFECIFSNECSFGFSSFMDKASFLDAEFYHSVDFAYSLFSEKVDFQNIQFKKDCSFEGTEFNNLVNFTDASFHHLDYKNMIFKEINFLGMMGLKEISNTESKKIPLSKKQFANKETARIIKAHFEKQNNITEANKYFSIEQELYIDELHHTKPADPNKYKNIAVLYLNKYVSYFGTDWVRPLLVMFIFGFLSSFGYSFLQNGTENINFTSPIIQGWLGFGFIYSVLIYIAYHRKYWIALSIAIVGYLFIVFTEPDFRYIINDISKLTNPLNIFKPKANYFESIAMYGMLVKLGMSVLIYQFIMAFRQNTRRK